MTKDHIMIKKIILSSICSFRASNKWSEILYTLEENNFIITLLLVFLQHLMNYIFSYFLDAVTDGGVVASCFLDAVTDGDVVASYFLDAVPDVGVVASYFLDAVTDGGVVASYSIHLRINRINFILLNWFCHFIGLPNLRFIELNFLEPPLNQSAFKV